MATPKTEPEEKKPHGLKWLFWVLADHIIATLIVCSIVFAFIVHWLFSTPAPNEWWIHKWGAGDILTYVSTIALGLLAVWQNKRFKEENDISQARLEQLSIHANELSVISKIIEIESNNLQRLNRAMDDFSSACDPVSLATVYASSIDSTNPDFSVSSSMKLAEKRIDDSFFTLSRELRTDNKLRNNDHHPLKRSATHFYSCAKLVASQTATDPHYNSADDIGKLVPIRNEYIKYREKYLIEREKMLNLVLYGNLSLDEIKKMYHSELTPDTEVEING